MNIVM